MPTTLIVEPDPRGHRFQAAANVARVAGRADDVLVLTSKGATAEPAFAAYLGAEGVPAREVFDAIQPPTDELAGTVARVCAELGDVSTVVVMDADQSLKRWWYVAPKAFRGATTPRVVFLLTRYPARLGVTDLTGWRLRVPKAALVVAAMASGSLHRAGGFAGRDDMAKGWIVKRARDLDVCGAHSRDRAALRSALGLPADRRIVGILGVIGERKNAPLIWEAMRDADVDADLLLAGAVQPEVAEWIATVAPTERRRILVRDAFLSNEELDQLVAAVDVVAIALTNNGPSGIMGKALSADVAVVTAGSQVRAREVVATDGGLPADLTPEGLGAAIGELLARDQGRVRHSSVPPATAEEFAEKLLGVDEHGRRLGRAKRPRRASRGV